MRSLLTLEALTFAPTGGIVAAPTTSLPEALGGSRNWDYRYLLGARRDAHARSVDRGRLSATKRRGGASGCCARAAGEPEHAADDVRRRAANVGSPSSSSTGCPATAAPDPCERATRAHEQLQLDVYGELTDVLWQGVRADMMLERRDVVVAAPACSSRSRQRWREPDEGIWEVRGPRRHFTHSKVMCWVAFDRAVAIADAHGLRGSDRAVAHDPRRDPRRGVRARYNAERRRVRPVATTRRRSMPRC